MHRTRKLALFAGGLLFFGAAACYAIAGTEGDLTTVLKVDLDRYLGKWYEIARYPNRFQKKCAGNTTATYSLREDGKITVLNACEKADGKLDTAKGTAKVANRPENTRLRVTFFWPFYGDYWVIGLDPEYRWAVVGEPGRKYLWILSRMPNMSDEDYQAALRIIREKGYDPEKLISTPQSAAK